MTRLLSLLLALPMLAAAPAALAIEPSPRDGQLLREVGETTLLPRYQQLARHSQTLSEALNTLCAAPDAQRLDAARQRWRDAYLDWMAVAPLNWGPTALARSHRQLAFQPARPDAIEQAISADAGRQPDAAQRVGAPARGLAAIEYLLWTRPAQLSQPARCAWLTQQGQDAAAHTAQLAADWREFASQLARAGQADAQLYPKASAAIEELANLLIAGINELRDKTLLKLPRLKADAVPGQRSGSSKAAVLRQFDTLRTLIRGADGKSGLADYLDHAADKPVLARQLRDSLEASRQAIAALPDPLTPGKAGAGQAAAQALKHTQTLLENPVTDALGITVSFNESDGD